MEELAEGQGGKGHSVGGGAGHPRIGEHVFPQKIGRQGQQAHHGSLPDQPEGEGPVKKGAVPLPRLLLHDPRLHRLHPQSQGGQGIGHQVEPQQLHRHQRHLVEPEEGGQEDGEDLADVAGEQVVDGLADVGVDPPALLHRRDHSGKIVVGEDHVGGPLGHVGARDAHSAADVGRLEGGRVVDAVPRHGHHLSLLLPRLDDAHFVLRGHPGKHRELLHVLLQQLLGHEIQVLTGDGQVAGLENIQLLGNGHGSELVVPGDHHRPDAGGVAAAYRLLYLRPGRVNEAHQPHKGKTLLNGSAGQLPGQELQVPVSHAQYPQRPTGHQLVGLHRVPPLPGRNAAPPQQHVGRPLHQHPESPARPGMDSAHQLPVRVKGKLPPPGHLFLQPVLVQPLPPGQLHQGGLGGVAHTHRLSPPVMDQLRVAAQRPHGQGQLPVGRPGGPYLGHRHFVLGQSARLVRTDDPRAAQSLHRRQLFDDGIAPRHAGHPQRQHDGDHRGQSLRNGGHRQRDRGHEHLQHGIVEEHPHAEHHPAHAQAHKGQGAGHLRHLFLEGRLPLGLSHQHPGDAPHLGIHSGGGDHGCSPPGGDHRGREHHIAPVGHRRVGGEGRAAVLEHRHRLPGHGALVAAETGALQDTGVGGHQVSRLQPDDIPRYQRRRLHPEHLAVPDHPGPGG